MLSSAIEASIRAASWVPYTGAVPGWRTNPRVTVHSNRVSLVSAATAARTASARSSSLDSIAIAGWRESTSVLISCALVGRAGAVRAGTAHRVGIGAAWLGARAAHTVPRPA